jgi:hypothetical protein
MPSFVLRRRQTTNSKAEAARRSSRCRCRRKRRPRLTMMPMPLAATTCCAAGPRRRFRRIHEPPRCLTRMPMPPASPPATTNRLQYAAYHAAIHADSASQSRRCRGQGQRRVHPLLAAAHPLDAGRATTSRRVSILLPNRSPPDGEKKNRCVLGSRLAPK